VRLARYILFRAWGEYGLLWLPFVVMPYWPWPKEDVDLGDAMMVMLGFSAGWIMAFALLLLGVVLGWRALRHPPHRTWPNLVLEGISIFGAAAQAFFAGLFFGVI